jgi:periplasmic protein TonB
MEFVNAGHAPTVRGFIRHRDAVCLVRMLTSRSDSPVRDRAPITMPRQARRRGTLSLVASSAGHALVLVLLAAITSLRLFGQSNTEVAVTDHEPVRLVFLMEPGPGGGGGGGGAQIPLPVPPAARKAPAPIVKKISSPVPAVQRAAPAPVPTPAITPPPPAPRPVVAPVVPIPADPVDMAGALARAESPAPSRGPGTNDGAGAGAGGGVGEGQGAGIGPGSGGGTGGGPFQAGNGVIPPTLAREVKPLYTDEARRRRLEGDVVLEIVVRRDGSVGNVRVLRTLGAGLEQKAVEAVRQWRFGPATRQGAPVDVVVEVSVGFTLR